MVDRPKLEHLLDTLRAYEGVLAGLAESPRDAFLANPDKVGNAKYHFVIAIETCIAMANHVIASEGLRFPNDNADAFAVLAEGAWVPMEQRDRLTVMARFRNRLVHLYQDIDDARVHDYLQTSLTTLAAFRAAIARDVGADPAG